jgi:hypothetical protein
MKAIVASWWRIQWDAEFAPTENHAERFLRAPEGEGNAFAEAHDQIAVCDARAVSIERSIRGHMRFRMDLVLQPSLRGSD